MKRSLLATALLAGLSMAAPMALADGVHNGYGHGHNHGHVHPQSHHHNATVVERVHVTISCFRGPWNDVIWDRPEPVFVDTLVNAGYTFPEAHAIAERVCRDIDGVDNPGHSQAVMMQIFQDNPPHWHPGS